jgi:peptidyl-prolyl cis-trans isomerase D
VVKVNEIKPALTVGFEQARPQLEQQLKHDAAQKKVYEQVEAYEKAHDGGANLAEAAKTVGATVVASGPIAQNGATPTGAPPAGVSPKLLAKAFEMAQGEESDTQDEGNGEYFVVRVDKVSPSAFPPLEEVRGPATQAYIQRQIVQALKAKADELAARIKKGESFEAVAASAGAKVEHVAGVDRGKAQEQAKTSGVQVLQAVFGAAKGDVVVAPTNTGIAVVKVDDIQAGPIDQLAALADTSRRQANGELVNNLIEGAQAHARRELKPKIDKAKAAQALGIDPKQMDQKPAEAPAPKGKG